MQYSLDIKNVTFCTHNYLLEKVQTTKPNFRDITLKILLTMLEREQTNIVMPELLKRFRSKNPKLANFALHVVNEAFNAKVAEDEINIAHVFKNLQPNLCH